MRAMSYDLAVWEGARPANDAVAGAEFTRLYGQYIEAEVQVAPTARIVAYVEALLARYPDLDPQVGNDDESPWSTAPLINEAVGPLIYFPMVWSRCEEVSAFAAQLAQDHGLNCYDPQWDRLRTELSEPWQFEITSVGGWPVRDPDAAAIRKILVRLSSSNYYAVLTRADDWYVQVGYGERADMRPGSYALERQDGDLDHHFRAELTDVEEVVRAFVAFRENDPSLTDRFSWRPYDLAAGAYRQ
jgi:hypothetical protein